MLLYTWKDVERKLCLNKTKWEHVILEMETYTNEMIVYLVKKDFEDTAKQILKDILGEKYDAGNDKILLDLPGGALNVTFDVVEET